MMAPEPEGLTYAYLLFECVQAPSAKRPAWLDEGQWVPEVYTCLDMGPTALRRWAEHSVARALGLDFGGAKAMTPISEKPRSSTRCLRQKDLDRNALFGTR